ncbi:histidine phosphatase family protein [Gracilibacillus sp. YIM 98692]|uniref:histidine phosphatase family protein n=1 Tax=Gracilibacillus sp. YIM 98692 TaxID=2663532 RepID=UPI001F08CB6D|nr:histidine phosphatase family protein [Gracilibacillus sp. YIM 98692]
MIERSSMIENIISNVTQRELLMNRPILSSLQKGGYILYARHAEATIGVDQQNLDFQDCSTQRNLSETGRQQAVRYGEAIRRQGIPVFYPVVTSPFCRNIETAVLAFGDTNFHVDLFWLDVYNLSTDISSQTYQQTIASLQFVLETVPPPCYNYVIIGHSFPKGVGLGDISDMGTVIVKPLGRGRGYEMVDKLSLTELINLNR